MEKAHTKTVNEILIELDIESVSKGLSDDQVIGHRTKYGRNELPKEPTTPLWQLILKQFDDTLVKILVASAIISTVLAFFEDDFGLHSLVEPGVIVLILVLNATIGVMQESNAEAAIEALKAYEAPHAKVIRNGEQQIIPAVDLVVGDIVQIAVGDLVPADLRLIELHSTTLRTDQSALTGESVSVLKTPDVVKQENIELQGKTNILFSGTVVTYGKGTGIVVTVGKDTEIGKINELLQTKKQKEEEKTPLQRNLDKFGANLSIAIGLICVVVWMINITHFTDPVHGSFIRGAIYYFKIAVALAVAAIPEGLVSVLTLTFASGTRKMAAKNAIMRSLPSVETLGCTSVICSDKTGTLTTNRMSVIKMVTVESENGALNEYDVRDTQYEPKGEIKLNGEVLEQPYKHLALVEMAKAASLSNDSNLTRNEKGEIEIVGEPTEAALRVMAEKIGVPNLESDSTLLKCKKHWESKYPKICTLEFTRERKSMSAYCKGDYLFVKGAYENIIARSSQLFLNRSGKVIPFTPTLKEKIISYIRENLSIKEALRCIGMAYAKRVINPNDLKDSSKFEAIETDLVFCGVAGLIDPPRIEVKPAIKLCRDAGIRVIIITGDNKNTAEAIGKRIGLFDDIEIKSDNPNALTEMGLSFTGSEFDKMTDEEKEEAVKTARLFARVEPAHKLTIVKLLQKQGHVVGMTGDGVNDSPALKQSDIGIAMGSGTSVAKSAGKMILQDDSFATIAVAVQEGRTIYANTKQFIRYLISSNIGEVVSIFLGSILGLPEHLNTIQLLFCNLVTDGLPANAIGYNKADPTLMKQPPRKKDEPIITQWQLIRFLITGTYVGVATVLGFIWWFLYASAGPKISFYELTHFHSCKGTECNVFLDPRASTISLSILVVIEMFVALSAVSENQSMFKVTPLNNPYLIGSVCLSMIIHIAIVYLKPLQVIFGVAAIGYEEWMAILGFSAPILIIEEILKFVGRNLHRQ